MKQIVVHWVGPYPNQKTDAVIAWWNKGEVFGSAHYVIDTTGVITRAIPEEEAAYHCGHFHDNPYFTPEINEKGLQNYYSIGIELIPIKEENYFLFSDATLDSAVELIKDLLKRYKLTSKDVIRHSDVCGADYKKCPAPFVEGDDAPYYWRDFIRELDE